jgi:hypothetical protein
LFRDSGYQKPIAVGRNHVLVTIIGLLHRAAEPGREQRYRSEDFGGSAVYCDSDRNRHEPAIQCDVEQFLPITPPTHLTAAVRGNLPPVSGAGERLDVDLNAARFIRLVRDSLAVRRELRLLFVEICLDDREWFSVSSNGKAQMSELLFGSSL